MYPLIVFSPPVASGFLPARGSFMLDVVAVAMVAVVISMAVSLRWVRRKRYLAHRNLQTAVAIVLAVTVVAFEIDVRLITDWRELAVSSPHYETGWVDRMLLVHLLFAIPTPLVWTGTLIAAWRRFPRPPHPDRHSRTHRFWGYTSFGLMLMTAVTGWLFYYLAFVA